MIGKLLGAIIGEKVAGRGHRGVGAIIGFASAALVRRAVPTIATAAALGWGLKKWREHQRSHPAYPSGATPSIPASDTRSPS